MGGVDLANGFPYGWVGGMPGHACELFVEAVCYGEWLGEGFGTEFDRLVGRRVSFLTGQ